MRNAPRELPPPAQRGRAATPIAFVNAIVLAYRRYGVDPAKALAAADIDPALLQQPAARISAVQMEWVSGYAMQELDDEALGWFARRLPWGSYGMLCRASLTSPNLGVALKRWCRHHRLLTEDIALELEIEKSVASVSIRVLRPLGEMHEFCQVTLLRYVLGYACWAIDSRIPLLESSFPFPAPPHADAYPLLFPCPLAFDAAAAAIRFDAHYLDLPIRRDENALRTMLQRALPLTVLQYRRDRLLVESVRRFLREPANGAATADMVAGKLHLSVRTLHRQLREEGSSLQQLKDEARRARAIELLHRSQRSIKQIATLVGFGNEKSFARAFKSWTGLPPQTFREQAAQQHRKPLDAPPTTGDFF